MQSEFASSWRAPVATPLKCRSLFLLQIILPMVCLLIPPATASVPDADSSPGAKLDSEYGVGAWIWTDQTFGKQTCRLWRAFEIPENASVTNARLCITGDNSYRVFLDGRELGQGFDWRSITVYDLTQILTPGVHVLAIEAFNEYNEAGVLAGLRISLLGGTHIEVASDESWRIVPNDEKKWEATRQARRNWRAATVIAPLQSGPWAWTLQREATGTGAVWPWFHITREPPLQPIPFMFWRSGWVQAVLVAVSASVILICFQLLNRLAAHKKARQILERERIRIARDIHDDLGAGLTQLVLSCEVGRNEAASASMESNKLTEIGDRGRSLLRTIDEVVWLVNARRDTLRDFETYVCSYAEKALQASPIRCRPEMDEDVPDLALDLATRRNLLLAIKEALNNTLRHSNATELFLRFQCTRQELIVAIEDDGKGFDPGQADASRNGICNMQQRLVEVGGICKLTSRPSAGCRVEFRIPLIGDETPWPMRWWRRISHAIRRNPATPTRASTFPAQLQ